jgi:hypothetical protein
MIRPVATRLNRIEDLLIEMRLVLDFHVKRIAALQKQVDILIKGIAVGDLTSCSIVHTCSRSRV